MSQSDCAAEIPRKYKNVVLYLPDPPFSPWRVEGGGSGFETKVVNCVMYMCHVNNVIVQTEKWKGQPLFVLTEICSVGLKVARFRDKTSGISTSSDNTKIVLL